jgi:2-C-methyl-D-erythritol 4-phosphate cytidylyltransferase
MIVPAAGAGVRLGAGRPKALQLLAGEPLLVHAARHLLGAPTAGCLVVAAPPGYEATFRDLLSRISTKDTEHVTVVTGGPERQQSVAAALRAVPPHFDIVLVHDAARALAPTSLVENVVAAVRDGHEAVIPVLPVVDTITQVDAGGGLVATLDRPALRAVQTPQGFRRAILDAAHMAAEGGSATDDAGLVARLGIRVATIPGDDRAMKITTARDVVLAECLLAG